MVDYEGCVRIPRLYRAAARVLTALRERKGTLAKLINEINHPHKASLKVIVQGSVDHETQLRNAFKEAGLFSSVPTLRLDLFLVLAYELFFGHPEALKRCAGNKKVDLLLEAEQKLRAAFTKSQKKQLQRKRETASPSGADPKKSRPRYVRVNTLLSVEVNTAIQEFQGQGFKFVQWADKDFKEWMERVKQLQLNEFMKDFHVADMLVFHPSAKVSSTALYHDSCIVLHDKGSALVAMALNPTPGALVLDACAAPGIKATYMASLMMNTGKIWAVDRSGERCKALQSAVRCSGASGSIQVIQGDFRHLDPKSKKPYTEAQLILLDPSCSGSGMTTRINMDGDDDPSWLKSRLKGLHNMQVMLLKHAMHFRKVQRIVYSTCSVHAEENEEVVAEALQFGSGKFDVVPALPGWPTRGLSAYPFGRKCVRMTPEDTLTSGFFIAVFERVEEGKGESWGCATQLGRYSQRQTVRHGRRGMRGYAPNREQRKRKAFPCNTSDAKKGRWESPGAERGQQSFLKKPIMFVSGGIQTNVAGGVGQQQKKNVGKKPNKEASTKVRSVKKENFGKKPSDNGSPGEKSNKASGAKQQKKSPKEKLGMDGSTGGKSKVGAGAVKQSPKKKRSIKKPSEGSSAGFKIKGGSAAKQQQKKNGPNKM